MTGRLGWMLDVRMYVPNDYDSCLFFGFWHHLFFRWVSSLHVLPGKTFFFFSKPLKKPSLLSFCVRYDQDCI